MTRTSGGRAEAALLLVCVIWGSTFVLVKEALDDISTVLFLALRFSLATVLLGLLWWSSRAPAVCTRLVFTAGVVTGSLLYGGYLLQTVGLRYTTAATSGFITGLYIVLVPLFAALIYRRAPAAQEWFGAGLATLGMGLMTFREARLAIGWGELLTLGCAVAFAGHILALGHYSRLLATNLLSFLQIAWSALIAACSFWWVEPVFIRWTPTVLIALGVTSVLATALAFWLQTWAQARTTPTRAAIIFSAEPLFAWLAAWVLAGEVLTGWAVAGATCILCGILSVELKPAPSR